jgi:D-aspartate ligase
MARSKPVRQQGKKVVIPGFSITSLSTARCLANSHFGIISIGSKAIASGIPMYFSNIPEKKVLISPQQNIVQALLEIRSDFNEPPVLLLTADRDVLQVSEDRSLIDRHYKFLLPPKDLVSGLTDKSKFVEIAQERGFKVPRTIRIRGPEEMARVRRELPFPFMLKPYLLHSRRINDEVELKSYSKTFSPINWSSVIAQEWIPGDDSTIHCCFVYFSRDSEPIAYLTLQKIRQWQPQHGTTSLCRTVGNSHILRETIRIFQTLGLVGYGQIEYKYHREQEAYYIMEPTVGRFNLQIAITQAAGVNIPLIAAQYLEEGKITQCRQRDNVWWIHERDDYLSQRHPLQTNRGGYWKHLLKADTHALFSWRDPLPFVMLFWSTLKRAIERGTKGRKEQGQKSFI